MGDEPWPEIKTYDVFGIFYTVSEVKDLFNMYISLIKAYLIPSFIVSCTSILRL